MKILTPAHNLKAKPVKNWREIKKEALELRDFIKKGEFEGYHSTAYAISQVQVSTDPKSYFVINEDLKDGEIRKAFGHWCIVNLKIIKVKDPVYFKEGCLSWPYREIKETARFNKITVKYQVPFLWFLIPRKRKLEGLCAFISAHENDHQNGRNIYGKYE